MVELKEELKKYKLPIYGTKVVLIQRLLNFKDDSNKLNGQDESQEVTKVRWYEGMSIRIPK